ncbi:MAG: hypothetical protein AB1418_06500 [Pseudomonadota bacterium]
MKQRWIKFQTVRISKNRERILKLLQNEEAALAKIESALSSHFALKPDAAEEKDAGVRKDIERLADAIATINGILQSRGRARSLFLDACGEYLENGALLRFEQLEDALSGDGGDLLVEAARSAQACLKVSSGRPPSPELNARLHLVGVVAAAAEKIGMSSGRGGDFEELIQLVYESAGIESDQGETIKAEGDIRKWQERQSQSGAG